ncbi:hypothetical protein P5673_021506 [Acropora cervicornis]|uniref:Uncharacterized protein n=1 Tax=Acropora cervicornis TaxID=6130 RepID=A0AAD9Q8B9_ACRCE|nr:hypothetical protein P5673_021506 [Acropora cervicornis]
MRKQRIKLFRTRGPTSSRWLCSRNRSGILVLLITDVDGECRSKQIIFHNLEKARCWFTKNAADGSSAHAQKRSPQTYRSGREAMMQN